MFTRVTNINLFRGLLYNTRPNLFRLLHSNGNHHTLQRNRTSTLHFNVFEGHLSRHVMKTTKFRQGFTMLRLHHHIFTTSMPTRGLQGPSSTHFLRLPNGNTRATTLHSLRNRNILPNTTISLTLYRRRYTTHHHRRRRRRRRRSLRHAAFFTKSHVIAYRLRIPFDPASTTCDSHSRRELHPQDKSFRGPTKCPHRKENSTQRPQ